MTVWPDAKRVEKPCTNRDVKYAQYAEPRWKEKESDGGD